MNIDHLRDDQWERVKGFMPGGTRSLPPGGSHVLVGQKTARYAGHHREGLRRLANRCAPARRRTYMSG